MASFIAGRFAQAAVWLDLRFDDGAFELEYQRDRQARTARFTANAIAFSALLWGAFGVWDSATNTNSVELTRFRFMVAIPILLGFFALTFTPAFRRWPNLCLLFFVAAASLLAIKQLLEYGEGSPYYLSSGSSALNFALILVFCIGLFPISVGWSCAVGAIIILVYGGGVSAFTKIEFAEVSSYIFNLTLIFLILIFTSYGRERFAREEFARHILQEKERNKLSNFLSSYIPLNFVADQADRSAEAFGEVTLLFSDLVGFTTLTEHLAPKHVLEILDMIFTEFDEAADKYGVEKVKTIGDAYMAIAGKSASSVNHAKAMVEFALHTIDIVRRVAEKTGYPLQIRVGIHTGSTIGGVIGRHKMTYDYWGRTVNLASWLESLSEPNRVHISEATYWRVRDFFKFEERQAVEVRGFGSMRSFFVSPNDASKKDGVLPD
ncbi:adenylate/guanylate cyclase domain-containing protein [Bradyrhizobium sp. BEA-2-5]|uniref:adenylate/guanylate cyclase domain-containing protein n=1 Tax=Bradyrhizobium sp. BEA-2-5 TaxID=3080015 RepID=UPI00293EF2AB|nr:adenylate/guanylate cyclase domain-containing protein [Bradyrhizobium sp. BEA-2-5]WOH78467.1 adenylate/guanylate cyclase domain-containing protein [Bradyrhizobium sp. BEA-2-5]